jgi:hypothetical protein
MLLARSRCRWAAVIELYAEIADRKNRLKVLDPFSPEEFFGALQPVHEGEDDDPRAQGGKRP